MYNELHCVRICIGIYGDALGYVENVPLASGFGFGG